MRSHVDWAAVSESNKFGASQIRGKVLLAIAVSTVSVSVEVLAAKLSAHLIGSCLHKLGNIESLLSDGEHVLCALSTRVTARCHYMTAMSFASAVVWCKGCRPSCPALHATGELSVKQSASACDRK